MEGGVHQHITLWLQITGGRGRVKIVKFTFSFIWRIFRMTPWHSKNHEIAECSIVTTRSRECGRVCVCLHLSDLCIIILNIEHRGCKSSGRQTYMAPGEAASRYYNFSGTFALPRLNSFKLKLNFVRIFSLWTETFYLWSSNMNYAFLKENFN